MRPLSALAALALFASCSGGSSEPVASADGRQDMLVIASQSDIGTLTPGVSESAADSYVMGMINYPLVDSGFDCSLKKLPGIATDWSWNEDGTVLSMTLRDDITFSDGHPLTAEDIAFTYDVVRDPIVASPRVSYVERMVEGKDPLVIDDTHIEWHFTQAYDRDTQMAHASAVPIMPKHIMESADRASLRGHDYSRNPMSTGPWKLASHDPNVRVVMEPNENFTGPAEDQTKLKRVVFQILPEYNTRLLKLESGEVDLMESILVSDADELRKNHPEINLVQRGYRSNDYVGWNMQKPMFQDVRVRRALAHATNVEDIMSKLLTGEDGTAYARRSVSTITPELCGVHNDDITPLAFNQEEARRLFAEAGWTDSNNDGILDKDGQDFEFTLTTNTGNKRRAQAAVFIQSHLAEVGVKVNIEQLESNTFFENLRLKNYEAALAGWSAGLFVDPSTIWHSDVTCEEGDADCTPRKYEFNFVSYSNPRADELMDRGLNTPIPEEAAPIWQELQQVIYEDQPYMFLWWQNEIVGVHERFQNTEIDVLSPYGHLEHWSVPTDQVKY